MVILARAIRSKEPNAPTASFVKNGDVQILGATLFYPIQHPVAAQSLVNGLECEFASAGFLNLSNRAGNNQARILDDRELRCN